MKSIALLFSICLFAGPAGAQDMKMHRKQAGAPDKYGWMLAKSTEGGFSVRLPLKFNDFTIVEKDPKAPVERTYTVGARSSENIALTATRIQYRKGAASAKEYFAQLEKGEGFAAKPESIVPRKVGALRAVDVTVRRPAHLSLQRIVLLDTGLVMMSVEAAREHETVMKQFATPFFDSLQVDAKQ
jgi:hypothetical protein